MGIDTVRVKAWVVTMKPCQDSFGFGYLGTLVHIHTSQRWIQFYLKQYTKNCLEDH